MTVIINYSSSYFSIILADRRTNFGEHQEYGYDDNKSKLIDLENMGWASGTGLSVFLEEFKARLSKGNFNQVEEMYEVFSQSVQDCKIKFPEWSHHIEESCATASWIGISEDLKNILFRIGLFSLEQKGYPVRLFSNKLVILYPPEYLSNIDKQSELEKRRKIAPELEENLDEVIKMMFLTFVEISNSSKHVSSLCDMGIQILDKYNILKLRISGEVEDLLDAIEKNELHNFVENISSVDLRAL